MSTFATIIIVGIIYRLQLKHSLQLLKSLLVLQVLKPKLLRFENFMLSNRDFDIKHPSDLSGLKCFYRVMQSPAVLTGCEIKLL